VTDVPYPDDIDRLVENIRTEINAQLGMARIELPPATVEQMASGIAANIDYAFDFNWHPRWVKGEEPHRWREIAESGGEKHFVECLRCKRITVHSTADDGVAWYAEHIQDHA
jgi:hypothetical protein